MYSHLLKKALPFTLTLVVGTALGGLFGSRGAGAPAWASWDGARREFGFGRRYGHDHCRMRRRYLVAETKPLLILFKPDAVLPRVSGVVDKGFSFARVLVTFGADGKVQAVEPMDDMSINAWRDWPSAGKDKAATAAWEAVERAARQIRFEPETINGMPVSVTKEVEIRFVND
jgi:hypothetical protein